MERQVRHTAHVKRSLVAICEEFERHGQSILTRATDEAGSHADRLILHMDQMIPCFDPEETVTIVASPMERRGPETAAMKLDWRSAKRQRILSNLDAELVLHAVIQSGSQATTAVSVIGRFVPPPGLRGWIEQTLLSRRVVEEVVGAFVDAVAGMLDAESELQA